MKQKRWNLPRIILLIDVISYLLVIVPVLVNVAFLTLMERKILGLAQLRKGPNKTSLAGILQPMADAVKLFTKESSYIQSRNLRVFLAGPALALLLVLWIWTLTPFAETPLAFGYSVILLLLVLSVGVYRLLLAGWSSNRKYSMIGALRGVRQTISYEVSLALILLRVLVVYKRINLVSMVADFEAALVAIVLLPIAGVWLVTCLAETNRTPFDFAEGESELVSGFNTEYGGGGFALIFMAEYAIIIFLRALRSILVINLSPRGLAFCALAVALMFFWIWARATYPRYRYDKLMFLAWKKFLPFTLHWCMVVAWVMVALA